MHGQMRNSLFYRKDIRGGLLYRDIGSRPERPFSIHAPTGIISLGDMMAYVVFASTIKNYFDFARLHICFRDVRPYSREIISLSPNADLAEAWKGEWPGWVRNIFPLAKPLRNMPIQFKHHNGLPFYDFILSDTMGSSRNLHGLPDPVPLQIPLEKVERLENRLVALGLDRQKWFAVIHGRESSYRIRTRGTLRNSNVESFKDLTDHIIDHLGGQVVRLGHFESTIMEPRRGLIDLCRQQDSFLLHACAVSRSRFMIAGPSGPVVAGWGFQIPTALVDATDDLSGWGSAENVVLTHEVQTPDGQRLMNRDLLESSLLRPRDLKKLLRTNKKYSVRKNSAAELSAVARHLFDVTNSIKAWRDPIPIPSGVRPNSFSWPPHTHENLNFLDVN